MEISVIIPTLQAQATLPALLRSLRAQSRPPDEIVVVDSASTDQTVAIARQAGCRVETITRTEFDHGRTRNLAGRLARGDVLVFMTQDAVAANEAFLEHLLAPLGDGAAAAAYARQAPRPDAPAAEAFLRRHNYGDRDLRKTAADIPTMGVRAFLFSNVAAAIRRDVFLDVGGFPEGVIVNEDMLFCARLLRAGHTVAYQSRAVVVHSHRYSLGQQFRRYFDIGVFFSQASDQLEGARPLRTGVRFARGQIRDLVRANAWAFVPRTVLECGLKFAGYRLGQYHKVLPTAVKSRLSRQKAYWSKHPQTGSAVGAERI